MDGAQSASLLVERLNERFGDQLLGCTVRRGHVTCDVKADAIADLARGLRDAPEFAFEQLIDVCGVDFSAYGQADWKTSEAATDTGFSRGVGTGRYLEETWSGERFAVVYQLLSISRNERLTVRCFLTGEPPRIASLVEVWHSADWFEREAFDLFGILFEGHPDLRRILTDYGFVGHPFRKDFPLSGHVEMRYDPDKRRVVYEPVSIEPRTLVPRVIRHDNRYHHDADDAGAEGSEPAAVKG